MAGKKIDEKLLSALVHYSTRNIVIQLTDEKRGYINMRWVMDSDVSANR